MSTGTLTIIAPDATGTVTTKRIETRKGPSLDDLQAAVSGYIERIRIRWQGRMRDAYINEEGKIHNLPVNREATRLWRETFPDVSDYLVGPVAIWIPDPKEQQS